MGIDTRIFKFWCHWYEILQKQNFTCKVFLSTGGTSIGGAVQGWLTMSLQIGLVIIVYTPVLSTTWSYWLILTVLSYFVTVITILTVPYYYVVGFIILTLPPYFLWWANFWNWQGVEYKIVKLVRHTNGKVFFLNNFRLWEELTVTIYPRGMEWLTFLIILCLCKSIMSV